MINARKLPQHTHKTDTHTTHMPDTCLGLLVSLADWQLLQHIWQISLQPKSCCKRNCKSITARRSAWRHDATATCGSDVNVNVAVTVLCRYRCRCRLRRRRHRIALIDCVYATQLLHSLCFGGFSFSFYVFFCLFRFLGRAILRCHMLHRVPHATHTLTHANTYTNKTSVAVSTRSMLCFGQVNRFFWQWAKTNDLGNELEIDFDTICHCN